MATLRTFVSIPLPEEVRRDLEAFSDLLRPHCGDAKWERGEKLHLTLKFLGDTGESLLPEVLRVLDAAAAAVPPFTLTVSGFGAFPSLGRPRVLWAGCHDDAGALPVLRRALDDGLAPLAFEREERAFHPHVTLARMRGDGVPPHLTSLPKSINFEPHLAPVTEIFLMRSVLKPAGSVHTVIGSSRLSQGAP